MRTEKKELNIQIRKRLQTVRENSGYTQEAFAEALDIVVEHYRKIELGMYGLQRENMLILYKKYKIDPTYLLTGEKNHTFDVEMFLANCSREYRNKATSAGKPQFYRFDKPEKEAYPKMIELFARTDFELKEMDGLTPIHIDDEVSSLSAILLNEDYYNVLLAGREVVQELSVLRPEYLILFKAKAYLDLSDRKEKGENVDSRDIRKHKNDILRIAVEFVLESVTTLPTTVIKDMEQFIIRLEAEPFDAGVLKNYGVGNEELVDNLRKLYNMSSN